MERAALLSDDVLDCMRRSVLCWLATVDSAGRPNVSPKEIFAAHGREWVLIAHIASPNSVRNIAGNPAVCLSFIDILVQKGYKLGGLADVVRPDDSRFATYEAALAQMTQGVFPIRAVMAVRVQSVEPILAPSYRLVAGTTEAAQIASARRRYGL